MVNIWRKVLVMHISAVKCLEQLNYETSVHQIFPNTLALTTDLGLSTDAFPCPAGL